MAQRLVAVQRGKVGVLLLLLLGPVLGHGLRWGLLLLLLIARVLAVDRERSMEGGGGWRLRVSGALRRYIKHAVSLRRRRRRRRLLLLLSPVIVKRRTGTVRHRHARRRTSRRLRRTCVLPLIRRLAHERSEPVRKVHAAPAPALSTRPAERLGQKGDRVLRVVRQVVFQA